MIKPLIKHWPLLASVAVLCFTIGVISTILIDFSPILPQDVKQSGRHLY
jgi:hypothetical protein